jgi:hypothetical protein
MLTAAASERFSVLSASQPISENYQAVMLLPAATLVGMIIAAPCSCQLANVESKTRDVSNLKGASRNTAS